MCVALELSGRVVRLGRLVPVRLANGSAELEWIGFARGEVLAWWLKRGAEPVEIRAERYSVRSEFDRQVRWCEVPPGFALRGLIDRGRDYPVLRLITRPCRPEEQARFQCPRMPVAHPVAFAHPPPSGPEASPPSLLGQLQMFADK